MMAERMVGNLVATMVAQKAGLLVVRKAAYLVALWVVMSVASLVDQ